MLSIILIENLIFKPAHAFEYLVDQLTLPQTNATADNLDHATRYQIVENDLLKLSEQYTFIENVKQSRGWDVTLNQHQLAIPITTEAVGLAALINMLNKIHKADGMSITDNNLRAIKNGLIRRAKISAGIVSLALSALIFEYSNINDFKQFAAGLNRPALEKLHADLILQINEKESERQMLSDLIQRN